MDRFRDSALAMSTIRSQDPAGRAPELTFPALYTCADEASTKWQNGYLRLVGSEYALLLLAAVLTLNLSERPLYYAAYALVFVISLGVLTYRTGKKPEQDWYRCRALAESVKTSTWRYVMRAQPFNTEGSPARAELRKFLGDLLKSNEHVVEKLAGLPSDGAQTTEEMEQVREMPWRDRRDYYIQRRVGDQRTWYSRKAKWNDDAAARWRRIGIGIYLVAVALVLARIALPDWSIWPTEPLIVAAAAVLGWVQIKKFNELASVYTLTALEIGLIEGKLKEVENEQEFSDFVNEAELAFSREHTQWVARQTNRY